MRVLLIEPMEKPRIIEVEQSLKSLQDLVGGYIQCLYPWEDEVAVICDEEGKLNHKAANRMLEDYDIICGTFLITGLTEDNFGDLSQKLADKYTEKFLYPETFVRMNDALIRIKVGSRERPYLIKL